MDNQRGGSMIEVICDETEQKEAKQVPIKLPKNLRQIGEGTNDTKIYIEDFVMTYIRKLAERDRESAGILLGEVKESGKETYIFVPGAIELKNVFAEDGNIRFDDEVWADAYTDIKQYFNKYMIVGWFLNRRSSCHDIDLQLGKIHIDNFPGADKIMFLADITEKEEAVYHIDSGELKEQPGYYVYYERNADMQEYMAAPIVVNDDDAQQPKLLSPDSVDAGLEDKTPENYRAILRERKEEAASGKHVIGVLYGACTFLAVVILMIGVAMMNNYDKIAGLEQLVSDLYEAAMERTDGQQAAGNSSGVVMENSTGNIWPTKSTEKDLPAETTAKKQEATKQTTTEAPVATTTEATTDDTTKATEPATDKAVAKQEKETTPAETQGTTKAGDDKSEDVSATGNPVSYYVVQDGDTLTSISKKFYNTEKMVEAIKAFNQLDDENYIFSGQVLNLP